MAKSDIYNYTKDLGPVIAAVIAFGVAWWQAIIQNKQRNLSLLERRYNLYDSFKILIKKFSDDCTYNEIISYSQFYKDFDELIYQAEILFDKKIKLKILEVVETIKELEEDYCKNRKKDNKKTKEHLEEQLRNSVEIIEEFYKKVSKTEKAILKFIKKSKI